jgi:nucleoid-associated protein YgaU
VLARRRLLAVVLFVVLLLGAVVAGRSLVGSLTAAPVAPGLATESVASSTYVVQPGDTVWSVARAVHAKGDIRGVVDRLVAANGGPTLRVGQRLRVP